MSTRNVNPYTPKVDYRASKEVQLKQAKELAVWRLSRTAERAKVTAANAEFRALVARVKSEIKFVAAEAAAEYIKAK